MRNVTLPPFTLPLTSTLVVSEFGLTIFTVYPPLLTTDHAGTARTALVKLLPVTLNVFVPYTNEPFVTVAARHCAAGSVPALTVGVWLTVNVLLQELVQPAALVTVTLYVPAAVRLLIAALLRRLTISKYRHLLL
jgi:hypothetical protein